MSRQDHICTSYGPGRQVRGPIFQMTEQRLRAGR